MKSIICFGIVFSLIFPLGGQSLPEDLTRAAEIYAGETMNSEDLFLLMNYRNAQKERLEKLEIQRDEVEERKKSSGRLSAFGWASLAADALALGAFGLVTVLGNDAYSRYMAETRSSAVDGYKNDINNYRTLQLVSLGTAGGLTGISALFFLLGGRVPKLNRELKSIDSEIELLREAVQ